MSWGWTQHLKSNKPFVALRLTDGIKLEKILKHSDWSHKSMVSLAHEITLALMITMNINCKQSHLKGRELLCTDLVG